MEAPTVLAADPTSPLKKLDGQDTGASALVPSPTREGGTPCSQQSSDPPLLSSSPVPSTPLPAPATVQQQPALDTSGSQVAADIPLDPVPHPVGLYPTSDLQAQLIATLGPTLLGSITSESPTGIGGFSLMNQMASSLPTHPPPPTAPAEVIIGISSSVPLPNGDYAIQLQQEPIDLVSAMVQETCLEPVEEEP